MLKPYPRYKASGGSWLGDVPDKWEVVPAKALFVERREINRADDEHLTPSQKFGVLPQPEYMSTTGNKVVLNLSGADAMRHVEPNDFISHLRSFQGGLELSTLRGKVSAAYTVLQPRSGIVAGYFKHLFKSTMYVQALQTTTDQLRDGQSIRYAQFARITLCLPSEVEQEQIADYLDVHTAKIDALIGKQERLIETLAERRQAVISHAVTKGLDPNAPMKDSCVDWLGYIPFGWSVPRVAHYFSITLGKMVNAGRAAGPDMREAPYLRAGNVQPYGVDIAEVKMMPMTSSELAQLALRIGDLVVVEGGQGGYGRSALVLEDLAGWGFQNHVMRVRPKSSESNAFLDYVLKTLRAAGFIASLSSHASLPSFSAEKLAAIRYGRPPLTEQAAIVEYLDRETAQIDALSAKAREMINVLKERRQALISAAVTGKIDVRGLS